MWNVLGNLNLCVVIIIIVTGIYIVIQNMHKNILDMYIQYNAYEGPKNIQYNKNMKNNSKIHIPCKWKKMKYCSF